MTIADSRRYFEARSSHRIHQAELSLHGHLEDVPKGMAVSHVNSVVDIAIPR